MTSVGRLGKSHETNKTQMLHHHIDETRRKCENYRDTNYRQHIRLKLWVAVICLLTAILSEATC